MNFNCKLIVFLCTMILIFSTFTGCGKKIEQTNEELNIYVSSEINETLNYPLRLYQQKYPDVKVNVKIISEDAEDVYYDTIKSGLMTGKNVTDILIVDAVLAKHCDVYKTEQAGAFIDLNTLFSEDPDYDASKYDDGVVKGLEFDGKQYIYPIAYHLPYILSTEEKLAELGMSIEEFQSMTVLDFFQFVKQKQQELGLSVNDIVSGRPNLNDSNSAYIRWYFPDIVDYVNNSFSFDTEEMCALIESMDILNQAENDVLDMSAFLYAAPRLNETSVQNYTREKLVSGEATVVSCLKDAGGNINADIWFAAAIPQLSPNQQNAYNFLKILLSDKVQNYKYDDETFAFDFGGVGTQVKRRATHEWTYGSFAGPDYASVRNADFAYREEVSGSFLYSEWSKLIMEQAEEYYKGNCSAEQAVESVEKKLKIYVSE